MKLWFDKKLFTYLTFGFIIMTIVGTVSHEFGHYFGGKLVGLNSQINYATATITEDSKKVITEKAHFIFIVSGPIQTLLTGTIGFVILLFSKNKYKETLKLSFKKWVLIFVSLFWLRQLANFFTFFLYFFINGKYSENSDEAKISSYLNLPIWSLISLSGSLGFTILLIIIFKFVPLNSRFTFILSGLFGRIIGYLFWLKSFGVIIWP